MGKKVVLFLSIYLVFVSAFLVACGAGAATATTSPSATITSPPTSNRPSQTPQTSEAPKYGGRLSVGMTLDVISGFDPMLNTGQTVGFSLDLVNEPLWTGDWAKGAAGGYGSNEVNFAEDNDVWDYKTGAIAQSWKWSVDAQNSQATIVYQIRPGMRWALNQNNEASRLANGREITAEDVVFNLKRATTDPRSYVYKAQPEMRTATISKTGPSEVTINLPLGALVTAITRFGQVKMGPPEVVNKYGDLSKWDSNVGSGPFILIDYVSGSSVSYARNPNYWMKDPAGPGKGNQLPYADSAKFLIIPDASTRLAALNTAKIDQLVVANFDDITTVKKSSPQLREMQVLGAGLPSTPIRIDKKPFTDVKVRRALFMATDFQGINKAFYGGQAPQVLTWPYEYRKAYADLYLGLDDPAMPASVKELYSYNPDKAKQLLTEAGYPNGFKTAVLITTNEVDYYSTIKDMWSKVGIDLSLDVRDPAVRQNVVQNRQQEALTFGTRNPVAIFYAATMFSDAPLQNASQVNDPYITDTLAKMRLAIVTQGMSAGMKIWKGMMPYVLDQAYHIPGVTGNQSTFWWPWLKGYSGEVGTGYYTFNWPKFIWIDQDLKKSMGR